MRILLMVFLAHYAITQQPIMAHILKRKFNVPDIIALQPPPLLLFPSSFAPLKVLLKANNPGAQIMFSIKQSPIGLTLAAFIR